MTKRPEPYLDISLCDIRGEEWLDIMGYDGIYSVSNFGRIKSESRFDNLGKRIKERILKQYVYKNGRLLQYPPTVKLSINNVKKTYSVAWLVGSTFLGDKRDNQVYCHLNKIACDNRVKNIAIKTISESSRLDFKIGVKVDFGIGDVKKQMKEVQDRLFNIYDDNGELTARICNKCFQEFPINEFPIRSDTGEYRRECFICRSKVKGVKNIGKQKDRNELAAAGLRYCSICKCLKNLDTDFYNNKSCFLGKSNVCIQCQREMGRKNYYYHKSNAL